MNNPEPSTLFGFDIAIQKLKQGFKLQRQGWNGKGVWVAMTPGFIIPHQMKTDGGTIRGAAAHMIDGDKDINILPHIDMRAADGSLVIGWLASQTDMLAEDWQVVP